MRYITALVATHFPIEFGGRNEHWAAGQVRTVDDEMAARFLAHPAVFAVSLDPPSTRKLSADALFYVRPDGSDSNNGASNTAAGAWLTIQHGIDYIDALDLNGFKAELAVADLSMVGALTLKGTRNGSAKITGNAAAPDQVHIKGPPNNFPITASQPSYWRLEGLELEVSTDYYAGLGVQGGAVVELDGKVNINFGSTVGGVGFLCAYAGTLFVYADTVTVKGANGGTLCQAAESSYIDFEPTNLAFPNNTAFSNVVAQAQGSSSMVFSYSALTGTPTGARFNVFMASSISTYASGANYIPGNAAGTADAQSGGFYA